MRVIVASMIVMFLSIDSAWALKCWQKPGIEGYKNAERGFLAYVTQTKLDEELWVELRKIYGANIDDSESVRAIAIDYVIAEEFKGDPNYKPALVDLLGAGHLGVTPGHYYFIRLGASWKEPANIRVVNTCNTPLQHYRLNAKTFQKGLDVYRGFRDLKK